MRPTLNIYEAKAHLSKLIAEVERTGKAITICRNGEPVVDLVRHRHASDPLVQDPSLGAAAYHGDPCAPVGQEDWPEELR